MPAREDLYVLAPGEDEDGDDGWVSPRPIDEVVRAAVADATDTDPAEIDRVESYVDLDEIAALLDGDGESESVTFAVEEYEVAVDGGGHVSVDPE
jgi:hypothetical protein